MVTAPAFWKVKVTWRYWPVVSDRPSPVSVIVGPPDPTKTVDCGGISSCEAPAGAGVVVAGAVTVGALDVGAAGPRGGAGAAGGGGGGPGGGAGAGPPGGAPAAGGDDTAPA